VKDKKMQIKRLLLPLLCLFLCNCYAGELRQIHSDISALQSRMGTLAHTQEEFKAQFSDGLTLALCSPELKQLLEDVKQECAAQSKRDKIGSCSTNQIKPAVIGADPEHRGRFLKMMSHLRHEVVYIGNKSKSVLPYRSLRIEKLARPALLDHTVFLVVSSPELNEDEAIRRAIFVEQLLLDDGVPADRMKRWIYSFPAKSQDIVNSVDHPSIAETKELSRGVWIFRSDC